VILVAGVGNIFFGDDAFGCEVVRRMLGRFNPPGVRIVDFGIRGLDLAYALTDGFDAAIIVDTCARGGEPGTIYVIDPDLNGLEEVPSAPEAHAMDPVRVLAMARAMGAELQNIHIVGCEPETFGPNEGDNERDIGFKGLSPRVAAAVDSAIPVIEALIQKFISKEAIA
jgi:hydrogenase maturation protease